jgi:membrane glycosyltransferase
MEKRERGVRTSTFLLLIDVTFLSSVGYEHFYESVYENPLWFFFFFLNFSLKIMCKFIRPTSFVELQLVTTLDIYMIDSL